MSNIIFNTNSKTVFTVGGQRNLFTVGKTILFKIFGTGPQGVPGTSAIERKLNIYKVRKNFDLGVLEFVTVLENITTPVSVNGTDYQIQLTGAVFDGPCTVNWIGGQHTAPMYLFYSGLYVIDQPSFILDGPPYSAWAWIIVEDLSQYIPT